MTYSRNNEGVCSMSTTVRLTNDNIIDEVSVLGGCDGSLKGVCSLLRGREVEEAIRLLKEIRCGNKETSCPGEISKCLREAMAKQKAVC